MPKFSFELKNERLFTAQLTLSLPSGSELSEQMISKAQEVLGELFHDLEDFVVEVENEPTVACKGCDGQGSIDYPNISGHDYSETCKACAGTGVLHE